MVARVPVPCKLFALLEHRFRDLFHTRPDIEMDEIHLWVTHETDGELLYTSWAEAEAWEYLQATFDRSVEETNLFESLWSNL